MPEFTPKTLTEYVNNVGTGVPMIVLEKGIPDKKTYPTSVLQIQTKDGTNTVAPLVSEIDGGKIVKKTTKKVLTVTAPRYRPKFHFTATELLQTEDAKRDVDAKELRKRQIEVVKDEQADKKEGIDRARERMACQLVSTGAIDVVDEYASFNIDFDLPAEQKPVLTGTEKFDDPDVDILSIFKRYRLQAVKSGIKKVIAFVGTETADLISGNTKVAEALKNPNIAAGKLTFEDAEYIGTISGVDTYVVDETFEDKDDTEFDMFPVNIASFLAVGACKEMFGRILDKKAPALAEFFAKSWDEEDPSGETHIMEARPLPALIKSKGLWIVTTH